MKKVPETALYGHFFTELGSYEHVTGVGPGMAVSGVALGYPGKDSAPARSISEEIGQGKKRVLKINIRRPEYFEFQSLNESVSIALQL